MQIYVFYRYVKTGFADFPEKRALRLKQNIYPQSAKFYGISAKETSELKSEDGQIQPTPNISQHAATVWPNARNILRPTILRVDMLRSFSLGLNISQLLTWSKIIQKFQNNPHYDAIRSKLYAPFFLISLDETNSQL